MWYIGVGVDIIAYDKSYKRKTCKSKIATTDLLMQIDERLEGGRRGAVWRVSRVQSIAQLRRELLHYCIRVPVERVARAHCRRYGA